MKTIRYGLAVFLITAAAMLAVLVLLWTFEVWHVGAPGAGKLTAFMWQFWASVIVTAALFAGGRALLASSRAKPPRERLSWQQIEKILVVAQDGAELLGLMDTEREAAKVILEGAFRDEKNSVIMTEAGSRLTGMNLPTPPVLQAAIKQARNLYAGVPS